MADEPQISEQSLLDLLELVQAQQDRADKILNAAQIQTNAIDSQRRQVQGILVEIPVQIKFALDQQNEQLQRIVAQFQNQGVAQESVKPMNWTMLAWFSLAGLCLLLVGAAAAFFILPGRQEVEALQLEKVKLEAKIVEMEKRGIRAKSAASRSSP